MVMEQFSGIPVEALLENDEKTTKFDLSDSGCGYMEVLVLAECLKVARRVSWNVPCFLGYRPASR